MPVSPVNLKPIIINKKLVGFIPGEYKSYFPIVPVSRGENISR